MFDQVIDQVEGTYLDLSKKSLVHLYKSLNQTNVSPGPGQVSQAANAYIFVFRNPSAQFEIAIGLHFADSGQRVLYTVPSFASEAVNDKVLEAEAFVGEMGFLMDNIRLSSLAAEEKSELLRKIPFFYKDMSLYQESLSTSEVEAMKAKVGGMGQKDAHSEMQKLFLDQYVNLVSML